MINGLPLASTSSSCLESSDWLLVGSSGLRCDSTSNHPSGAFTIAIGEETPSHRRDYQAIKPPTSVMHQILVGVYDVHKRDPFAILADSDARVAWARVSGSWPTRRGHNARRIGRPHLPYLYPSPVALIATSIAT